MRATELQGLLTISSKSELAMTAAFPDFKEGFATSAGISRHTCIFAECCRSARVYILNWCVHVTARRHEQIRGLSFAAATAGQLEV